jgi:hypothetical protein
MPLVGQITSMRRSSFFVVLSLCVAACSSSNAQKTPDGGTLWTSAPTGDVACSVDSDCCVAVDLCHSMSYVVHAGDALDIPQTNCNLCIAPAVQVWCSGGKCQNAVLPFSQDTQPLTMNHCGPIVLDAGTPPASDAGAHGCQ